MAFLEKTKTFLLKCRRVWYVLKKPSKKEFEQVTKVSAIGIALLGFIGFLISLIVGIFA